MEILIHCRWVNVKKKKTYETRKKNDNDEVADMT